jgi:hypothetical protein
VDRGSRHGRGWGTDVRGTIGGHWVVVHEHERERGGPAATTKTEPAKRNTAVGSFASERVARTAARSHRPRTIYTRGLYFEGATRAKRRVPAAWPSSSPRHSDRARRREARPRKNPVGPPSSQRLRVPPLDTCTARGLRAAFPQLLAPATTLCATVGRRGCATTSNGRSRTPFPWCCPSPADCVRSPSLMAGQLSSTIALPD